MRVGSRWDQALFCRKSARVGRGRDGGQKWGQMALGWGGGGVRVGSRWGEGGVRVAWSWGREGEGEEEQEEKGKN